ncbi:MAG: response regulator [Denitrovibrio sp.]|nr:MAG: response regulator [Denitrovibrio sp.]
MLSLEELKNLTVLYVEDDEITREMALRMLSKYFKVVYPAADGREGLELFGECNPDLIITDLSMPEMSGFEMINSIQKTSKDIPIIVTTAYRSEAEALTDVNAVVYKPVNKKILIDAVLELDINI